MAFKWLALSSSATSPLVDSRGLRPRLAVFALRLRANKNIAPAFESLREQSSLLAQGVKKPRTSVAFKWLALKDSNLQPTG